MSMRPIPKVFKLLLKQKGQPHFLGWGWRLNTALALPTSTSTVTSSRYFRCFLVFLPAMVGMGMLGCKCWGTEGTHSEPQAARPQTEHLPHHAHGWPVPSHVQGCQQCRSLFQKWIIEICRLPQRSVAAESWGCTQTQGRGVWCGWTLSIRPHLLIACTGAKDAYKSMLVRTCCVLCCAELALVELCTCSALSNLCPGAQGRACTPLEYKRRSSAPGP